MNTLWLEWARKMQAVAQNGLTFAKDPFDQERYEALRQLAAEVFATGSTLDLDEAIELCSIDKGYATPKVDMRGVVFQGDTLLMVKEKSDGCWSLPGGWADVGSSPVENVTREILEETGFQTHAVKILAFYDREKHPHQPSCVQHVYKVFILCKMVGGAATPSIETEAVGFFGEHELPPLSIARVTPGQVARCFEHLRHPDLPTDFD